MTQLLVRNVPPDVVEALRRRAKERGRSAEAEHRAILEAALAPARERFRAEASRVRSKTAGRIVSNTTDLIREDRDLR